MSLVAPQQLLDSGEPVNEDDYAREHGLGQGYLRRAVAATGEEPGPHLRGRPKGTAKFVPGAVGSLPGAVRPRRFNSKTGVAYLLLNLRRG